MSTLTTVKCAYEDGVVTFFDTSSKLEGGRHHNRIPGERDFQRMAGVASYMGLVRGCIQDDVDAGQADKIAQLHVADVLATIMVLDGHIPVEALSAVVEHDTYVDVPGVTIEGHNLTVRVFEYGTHPVFGGRLQVATADAEGNVLM